MSALNPQADQQQNQSGTVEHEIRLGGLKGTIWKNDGSLSVTASKSWQDKSGNFHDSSVTLFANETASMAAILTKLSALLIDRSLVTNKTSSTSHSKDNNGTKSEATASS